MGVLNITAAAWTAAFQWWRSGDITRTQNVSEYIRIEYKLLSLTYKVLTTTQPPYLHNLISVQPPRSTRSSSVVTLARPSTSSLLRITDRSFRYASPCLWNQLPSSVRQPHSSPSVSVMPVHVPTTSSRPVYAWFYLSHMSLVIS